MAPEEGMALQLGSKGALKVPICRTLLWGERTGLLPEMGSEVRVFLTPLRTEKRGAGRDTQGVLRLGSNVKGNLSGLWHSHR